MKRPLSELKVSDKFNLGFSYGVKLKNFSFHILHQNDKISANTV